MSCCPPPIDNQHVPCEKTTPDTMQGRDLSACIRKRDDGLSALHLIIDAIHCPSCIRQIEGGLKKMPGIKTARVTLATKRLYVVWDEQQISVLDIAGFLERLDFPPTPFNPELLAHARDKDDKDLLHAVAVAGFASANIMILSISVWSGQELGAATRDLFHWISALIALPAVAWSGRPFFRSAVGALRNRALNMDVPISLAVILAVVMSVVQTWNSAEHAYFDATVMLLFFLLIGRYLDRRMRTKAHSAAQNLLSLRALAAIVVKSDGTLCALPIEQIEPGMRVAVASGETIPVDGTLITAQTELDTALVTGESLPRAVRAGARVYAGTINRGPAIEIDVTARDDNTLLSEIIRLMETAQQGRAKYIRLADRAAQIYAPAVHGLSLLTFLGWFFIADVGWQVALLNAIAVLIITCPCALGLAVPTVQVVASGLLLKRGILIKSADGLERLALVDCVVFDKTGTLTEGQPRLKNSADIPAETLTQAAALALRSQHPLAQAVARAVPTPPPASNGVEETPGQGLRCHIDGQDIRMGKASWCRISDQEAEDFSTQTTDAKTESELWFRRGNDAPVHFVFEDRLRTDAMDAMATADQIMTKRCLLSGDHPNAVEQVARRLGFKHWIAAATPTDKITQLDQLADTGHRVLMVGDGLNDAPALSAASVSASPASGADISQMAADFIIQGQRLQPMIAAVTIARKTRALIFENFGLAVVYNLIAVPIAMAGLVTPLIASVAMSGSSLLVILNALRLKFNDHKE